MAFSTLQNSVVTEVMRLDQLGNVGIGTATPQAKLQVAGNLLFLTGANQTYINEGGAYDPAKGGIRNNTGNIVLESKDNGILFFNRDVNSDTWIESTLNGVTTEIAAVKAGGNVGIGTTTPVYKLDLLTTGTNDGVKVTTSSGRVMLHGNNIGGTSYSGLTQAGDAGLIYGNSSNTTNFGFVIAPWASGNVGLRMDKNGSVGIGTYNTGDAGYRLFVETGIRTRKITVDQSAWPDYVFKPGYTLLSLSSVATYIRDNGHLPDMPSADSVAKNGVDLGNNQTALLKKIEELTLYTIQQQEQIEKQNKLLEKMQSQIDELKASRGKL